MNKLRQCSILLKIQLLGFFGLNEALHSKDSKKKGGLALMGFCFLMLGIMFILYSAAMAFALGQMGAAGLIPAYMLAVMSFASVVITFLRAGSVLFSMKNFEILLSLPVGSGVLVTARFLSMYLGNLLFCALLMIPGAAMYGLFAETDVLFYAMILVSLFAAPLIPMTLSCAAAAGILALSSRMKYKNLVTIILMLLFTSSCILFSFSVGQMDMEHISGAAKTLAVQVYRLYPPAVLYTRALSYGSIPAFLGFLLLSAACFGIFIVVVKSRYLGIISALRGQRSRGGYVLSGLKQRTPLKAFYVKELRRYAASPVYVLNTAVGYLMMLLMAAGLLFLRLDRPETADRMKDMLAPLLPYALSFCGAFCSFTASSISMEGRQWWIAQSMPVPARTLFCGKILVNLTLALPCTAIAVALSAAAFPMRGPELFWLLVLPVLYAFFTSVLGLFINVRLPQFKWENEGRVVKQSGAVLCAMLAGMAATLGPALLLMTLGSRFGFWINTAAALAVTALTLIMYRCDAGMDVRKIGS